MRHHIIAGVGALIAVAGSASAALETPAFRGSAFTEFAGWESFTSAVGGANTPDDPATDNLDVTLTQTTPGASIISSGNLYSDGVVPVYEIADTAPDVLTDVVLQFRVLGLDFDASSIVLEFAQEGSVQSVSPVITEISRTPLGGFGGESVEWRFDFDLTGLGVTSYVISGDGGNANISLDRMELDTAFVPAPGGVAALGGLGLLAARRRRR